MSRLNNSETVGSNGKYDMETLSLLLRDSGAYSSDYARLKRDITAAFEWHEAMVKVAKSNGLTLGTLCRLVLPFDVNTDARDQSNIPASNAPLEGTPELPTLELRSGAVLVRKMLRIKLADEADMKQAKQAITMIMEALNSN